MPIINDPGFIILREITKKNISYEILPGSCALINGLYGSGFDSTKFVYMGFIQKPKVRKKNIFENFKKTEVTGVFCESSQTF